MNKQNIGMVYVATRRPYYVAEAFLSAHSARDFMPDLPVTLCTDLPDVPFARSPCFSAVLPLETRRRYRSLWAEGQLDRIRALRNSPYDYTLHLDTDTRVLTPELSSLFRKLDDIDIGMAVCQPDVSRCAQLTGLPIPEPVAEPTDPVALLVSALRDPLANLTASSASTTVRTAILNQRAALDALLAALETP